MSDIYSGELQNHVLTLENDSSFIKECEELASAMSTSFYKTEKVSDRHSDVLMVKFSYNRFLSYSIQALTRARMGSLITKYCNKNNLEQCYDSKLKDHFLDYYITEIMLGAFLPDEKDLNILKNIKDGVTKKQAALADNVSVYYVNKVLDRIGLEAYDRMIKVQNGEKYQDVMSECINAHNPKLTAYQIDPKKFG